MRLWGKPAPQQRDGDVEEMGSPWVPIPVSQRMLCWGARPVGPAAVGSGRGGGGEPISSSFVLIILPFKT